eukprot:gene6514-18044_t
MPRKTKEVDEVYLRLKFAIEQWWEKNGHTIDATSSRFKPKHVLGRFLYSLGGRVEHPKLGQWFAQILTRTIQATGGNKKRKRKRGGGEWAAKQAAEGGGAATEATAGAAADGDANGESETSPAKKTKTDE